MTYEIQTIQPVAPEDLKPGEYITVLWTFETLYPPFDPEALERGVVRTARARTIPPSAGVPFRIEDVCLPFVGVKCGCGCRMTGTLDLRVNEVARLPSSFAETIFRPRVRKRHRAQALQEQKA